MTTPGKVGLVGSGLVGKSWAMIFASVGYEVIINECHKFQRLKGLNHKENRFHAGLDVRYQARAIG